MLDNIELGPILLGTDLAPKYLGRLTSSAWTAFARTGNPNTPGLPQWPKYDASRRATMIFDVENKVVNESHVRGTKNFAGQVDTHGLPPVALQRELRTKGLIKI